MRRSIEASRAALGKVTEVRSSAEQSDLRQSKNSTNALRDSNEDDSWFYKKNESSCPLSNINNAVDNPSKIVLAPASTASSNDKKFSQLVH